jgi:hypothetical protein
MILDWSKMLSKLSIYMAGGSGMIGGEPVMWQNTGCGVTGAPFLKNCTDFGAML